MTAATGPKISTSITVEDGSTSVKIDGANQLPEAGSSQGACSSVPPSALPFSTISLMRFSWMGSTMAPMSTDLSSGSPTRRLCMRRRSFARNFGAMPSCTRMREPAQQTWPWLNQMASTTPSTAASRSASSCTMKGDFPPSSSDSFLAEPAVALRMMRPTSVEPVKAILSTCGCSTSAAPVAPSPVTMLTTPGGRPASRQISAKASAVKGVNSAGFSTTVLPAASAGAIFQASISSGKFHGMIWPQTPTGWWPGNSSAISSAQPAW